MLDAYTLTCQGGKTATVPMDMYHRGYREMRPIPGFTVLREIPARVAKGCPPLVDGVDAPEHYVFNDLEVERRASLAGDEPHPHVDGVQGRVFVEFTVDTSGKPEPDSVDVKYVEDERLRPFVRDAVAGMLFKPAEHHAGCPVRQRVAGPIQFR